MLQSDRVWNSLSRRRGRVAPGSDGRGRRRLAIWFFVFVGLVMLSSMLMLLAWTTAALPPRMLEDG
jgi:hypothetical protein